MCVCVCVCVHLYISIKTEGECGWTSKIICVVENFTAMKTPYSRLFSRGKIFHELCFPSFSRVKFSRITDFVRVPIKILRVKFSQDS